MKRTKIKDILQKGIANETVVAKGWVRTRRGSKNVFFIALNDGSIIHNLQVVVDVNNFEEALLYEPNSQSVIFTSIIDEDVLGFDGRTHDFEMIVLEDGRGTDTATTTYYFYVELE